MSHTRYQGKMVSVIRTAQPGDPGYDELLSQHDDRVKAAQEAHKTDPTGTPLSSVSAVKPFPDEFVLVKTEDETEMVLRKTDITDDPRSEG